MYGGSVLGPTVADEGLGKTYLDAPHMGVRGNHQWVVLEIRARASSEDFRYGMEMCLHALEMTQATRLLMDLRTMRLVLVDDERWLAQDLLPRFATTALKRMAIVRPENALARAIVADLAKPRPTGTESKHCETVEEAKQWLSGADSSMALAPATASPD
jgi:SpoIIAA-like